MVTLAPTIAKSFPTARPVHYFSQLESSRRVQPRSDGTKIANIANIATHTSWQSCSVGHDSGASNGRPDLSRIQAFPPAFRSPVHGMDSLRICAIHFIVSLKSMRAENKPMKE